MATPCPPSPASPRAIALSRATCRRSHQVRWSGRRNGSPRVHELLCLGSLRDRAVVAFILLTGARDGAVFTFKLKHLDVARGVLHRDAREVATKLGKSFDTYFFP